MVWAVTFVVLSARTLAASLAMCLPIVVVAFLAVCASLGMPRTFLGIASTRTAGPRFMRWFAAPQPLPCETPRFLLVTHPVAHYAERLRWCLDLARVPYAEANVAGLLPALLRGWTVPRLVERAANSITGNSEEARMYVAAVHVLMVAGELRAFADWLLERTPTAIEWELRLGRLGHAIQGFVYYYMFGAGSDGKHHGAHHLRLWGVGEPRVLWLHQRLLKLFHPLITLLMRKATLSLDNHELARTRRTEIEEILDVADTALATSTCPHLLGSHMSYIDVTSCSLVGLLLVPTVMLQPAAESHGKWANGRFASYVRATDGELATFPVLLEFEKAILKRPMGRYVRYMYSNFRSPPPL